MSSERSISASSSNSTLLRWAASKLRRAEQSLPELWRRAGDVLFENSGRLSPVDWWVKSLIVSPLKNCMSFCSNRMNALKHRSYHTCLSRGAGHDRAQCDGGSNE